jgi:glucose/arabinose dehydrogenase
MTERGIGWVLVVLLAVAACSSGDREHEIVLDGLNEPRGLLVLPDGTLCVAEAGKLDDGQVVREGPTANRADTGSVSCADPTGERLRIIQQLPHVFYNATGVSTGPADLATMDGDLHLLTGESEGPLARKLLRLTDPTGPPEIVADFLAFATDTAEPDFFDETFIFSNPFAMIPDPANKRFLVTDGATGHVLAAGLDGDVRVFSEVTGHEVLTGIARGPDGLVYVASFSQLPHETGDGAVLRLHADGSFGVAADNLTTPIDIAFDATGRLYVLEFIDSTETGDPYRGKTGRLLRLDPSGDGWVTPRILVQGLPFPTALLIDGDERLYISIRGAFSQPGRGEIVRFDDLARSTSIGAPIEFMDEAP